MLDYFPIIHQFIEPSSKAYRFYISHVTMVTGKALNIAKNYGMPPAKLRFIEEAAMLHDIGIVRTNIPHMGCHGKLPYISHVIEGSKILQSEGLEFHARIAANHIGVGGISAEEIKASNLPLPEQDLLCESDEEFIISYADLFFSKNEGELFYEIPVNEVREKVKKYGKRQAELFEELVFKFEPRYSSR